MEITMVKKKFISKLPERFFQELTVEKYKNALRYGQQHFFNICNTAVTL